MSQQSRRKGHKGRVNGNSSCELERTVFLIFPVIKLLLTSIFITPTSVSSRYHLPHTQHCRERPWNKGKGGAWEFDLSIGAYVLAHASPSCTRVLSG